MYRSIALMSRDAALLDRLAACAAVEGEADPETWVAAHRWRLVASHGWEPAYSYALETGVKDPGASASVISDGMILAATQVIRTTQPTTT